ncbi:MAG: hypothetical protein ACK5NK_12700 [Niabella sp.]
MLTEEQTQHIDNYFKNNGVSFYDIREELVDHLSQLIEERINIEPNADFYQLFKQEAKKFDKKELSMQNYEAATKYEPRREWNWFTIQRIVNMVLAYLLLLTPAFFLTKQQLRFLAATYLAISMIFYVWRLLSFKKNYKPPSEKLSCYLPEPYITTFFFPIYFFYKIVWFIRIDSFQTTANPIAFFAFILFILLLLVTMLIMKQNIKQEDYKIAKSQYPHLFKI